MPKTKISEFSATPANNTDIDSINIAEGCAPSGINDAIRELMAQLKDFQTGAVGDSFNGPVGTSTAAAGAFTTLSSTGNTTLGDASGDAVTINGTATFANANPTLTAGTANGVTYLNGSKVLTSGSALTFDGTKLGVGSSSYGDAGTISLSVGVAGTTSGGLQLWASPTQEHYIQWGDSTTGSATYAGAISYDHASNFMRFWTSSAERMRLDSSGNLGIGTTTPYAKIQVSQSSSTLPVNWIFRGNQSLDNNLPTTYGFPYLQIGKNEYRLNSLQTIGFGYVNANGDKPPAEIGYISTSVSGETYGDLVFATRSVTTNTAATERMRIDSAGKVGIGLSSSLGTGLSVNGAIRSQNDASNISYLGFTAYTGTGASGLMYSYIGGDGRNTGYLTFNTVDAERARIDSSGNLLVGTTTASSKLTVASEMSLVTDNNNRGIIGWDNTLKRLSFSTINASTTYFDSMSLKDGNLLVGSTTNTTNANLILTGATRWAVGTQGGGNIFYIVRDSDGVGQYMVNGSTSWTATSDERLKDIIEPISNAASKVSTLRAVIGKFKKDAEGTRRSFLIAQDVQAVLPEAVTVQEDEFGTLGVQYTEVIPLLVAAIKEQTTLIESLKARFDAANL